MRTDAENRPWKLATVPTTKTWPAREQPWTGLPSSLSPVLMPHLSAVAQQLMDAARHDVPVYAGPLEGAPQDEVRYGVQLALTRFLELPGTDQVALQEDERRLYEGLGRVEVHQGRPMNALFAAYRSGARTTLRAFSRVAMDAGFEASVLIGLAESVFAYIEELSAASAEGYATEQSEQAGERDRLRGTITTMLLHGHGDEDAVRAAAQAAGWALPERVVATVLDLERHSGLRSRLGERALVTVRPGDVVAVVPEPATLGERRRLEQALSGRGATIGPGRAWPATPESLRLAVTARELLVPGRIGADAPLWVSDHLLSLTLHASRGLLEDLARQRLAPMQRLKPGQRQRLRATLLSWLKHQGRRAAMAAELGVHEQTVGYRIHQLRDLFGEDLEQPQTRFELELALRGEGWSADPLLG